MVHKGYFLLSVEFYNALSYFSKLFLSSEKIIKTSLNHFQLGFLDPEMTNWDYSLGYRSSPQNAVLGRNLNPLSSSLTMRFTKEAPSQALYFRLSVAFRATSHSLHYEIFHLFELIVRGLEPDGIRNLIHVLMSQKSLNKMGCGKLHAKWDLCCQEV